MATAHRRLATAGGDSRISIEELIAALPSSLSRALGRLPPAPFGKALEDAEREYAQYATWLLGTPPAATSTTAAQPGAAHGAISDPAGSRGAHQVDDSSPIRAIGTAEAAVHTGLGHGAPAPAAASATAQGVPARLPSEERRRALREALRERYSEMLTAHLLPTRSG